MWLPACPRSLPCVSPLDHWRPPLLQTWPNQNKREEVERIKHTLLEQLQQLRGAPGFAMAERPPEALEPEFTAEDEDQAGLG